MQSPTRLSGASLVHGQREGRAYRAAAPGAAHERTPCAPPPRLHPDAGCCCRSLPCAMRAWHMPLTTHAMRTCVGGAHGRTARVPCRTTTQSAPDCRRAGRAERQCQAMPEGCDLRCMHARMSGLLQSCHTPELASSMPCMCSPRTHTHAHPAAPAPALLACCCGAPPPSRATDRCWRTSCAAALNSQDREGWLLAGAHAPAV